MNPYLITVDGEGVAIERGARRAQEAWHDLVADGVAPDEVALHEISGPMRRFSRHGRSALILSALDLVGPAGSIWSLMWAHPHRSTRYHYESVHRLAHAGLVDITYTPAGRSSRVAITARGRALLVYWALLEE